MGRIEDALIKKFESHRVIFWYDGKKELLADYEQLDLRDIEKIHVSGNEFEIKYTVLKASPNKKFLLYFTSEKPANEDNWLLDMELAHHVFHTDQEAMFLQEVGLGYHFKELVTNHIEFFKSKERRFKLKELLGEGDEHEEIRGKMLAVTFATGFVNLNSCIHAHATSFIEENDKFDATLERFQLGDYYWERIEKQFNYRSDSPSIYDFLHEVFNENFSLGHTTSLKKESRLLLLQWKDTIQFRDSFSKVSDKLSEDMDVESKLQGASIEDIVHDDLFKLVNQKVIHELVTTLVSGSFSIDSIGKYLKLRENKFWYTEYRYFYNCIEYAAHFIHLVGNLSIPNYKSIEEGVMDYSSSLYEVDQLYRKFIFNYRKTNQNRILDELETRIEKVYANDWLLSYNNSWQKVLDHSGQWPYESQLSQRKFFEKHVRPSLAQNQRLFVVISDALRYECGAELSERILAENRYESEIDVAIASIPSYTQIGMASLLPNENIAFQEGGESVVVDGISASGVQGRSKILSEKSGVRATAINADDFLKMNSKKEGRDFVKQYDLIYIYHNKIDKAGDDTVTEENVFNAVDEELDYLLGVLKKISNVNGNNMLITSDHGFLYQHNDLDESDYMGYDGSGEIWKKNRRFVIGTNLEEVNGTTKYSSSQLGIDSDADIVIPKSVNRIRVKGAGSRFVHGGSSLQEIVIPVVKVSKKRKNTTSQVDIDIIKTTDRITTNILAVSFIQSNLVTEKVLSRTIRASIIAEDGEVLSDVFTYSYDIEEGSERQREVKHRFQLFGKASGKYKNQRVRLVLEEPIEGTTKWKQYKEYFYTLNISFTNDFDDF